MKKTISILLISFFLTQCGNPGPTELVQDETSANESVDLQVVSTNPDEIVYSNGYDSTGIVDTYVNKSSVIGVSGIKYSNFGTDAHIGYYYAVFNDKANPIVSIRGRQLGFRSRQVGSIRFNNSPARIIPNRIHFMRNSAVIDSVVGWKYVLVQNAGSASSNGFPYNSKVQVLIDRNGMRNPNITFDIPTPIEIIGNVETSGRRTLNNLKLNLTWNGTDKGKIEVIIGEPGSSQSADTFTPLLKITCPDNGRLKIDSAILNRIPVQENSALIITFIRRLVKEIPNNETLNDNYIVAQSIHNIRVNIPR